MMMMRARFAASAAALLLCFVDPTRAGQGDDPLVFGQTFMAGSLNATEGSEAWALTSHGIAEKLFTVNEAGDIVGQVADSVSRVDDNTWDVTLKDGYMFSDGTPVTAERVAAALEELNAANPAAQSSLGALTATASDDLDPLTVRIESAQPTHIMDSVLAEWAFPVYYVNDDGEFVFTGPYAVAHFEEGDHMDLIPNEFYIEEADRPNIEIKKFADGDALAEALQAGMVDVAFHLPIDTLPAIREEDGVHTKSFEVGYSYMMIHNLCRPQMEDVRVREAIDLALSRNELSQALQGGRGTRSFFPDNTPFFSDPAGDANDEDAERAAELLDEAGWILDPASGKRTNAEGEALAVKLVAYPHRPGLGIMQPRIAETLEDLGISVESVLTGDDWSETQEIIDGEDFDLLMWAQHTLPAGDPGWFLNAFFRTDGGKNMGCFASSDVDGMLDELSTIEDPQGRVEASNALQARLMEEVPISNLVTPDWHVGLSERVRDYKPWGSDYYVIRSDLHRQDIQEGTQPQQQQEEGEEASNEDERFYSIWGT